MDDLNQYKLFTVEEANQLTPRLTALILQLQKKREDLLSKEVEIDALEMIVDQDASGQSNLLNQKVEEYRSEAASFYAGIDEIHSCGCLLKDLTLGLVDFYSQQKGKVVYLCWKLGDPSVAFWHEIGSGYAHRQPINE